MFPAISNAGRLKDWRLQALDRAEKHRSARIFLASHFAFCLLFITHKGSHPKLLDAYVKSLIKMH